MVCQYFKEQASIKDKIMYLFVSRHYKLRVILAEEADGCICSGGEDPRLCGVELHIKNPEVMGDHMTPEDLDWDDERVLQQVAMGRRKCVFNHFNDYVILNCTQTSVCYL